MTGDAAPRVLVPDALPAPALALLAERGVIVDYQPGLGCDRAALVAALGVCDGLIVRSATKVTGKLLAGAGRLKVIGRAGVGIETIDVAEATRRGVIVMNAPSGNAITTAEHAIALMLALARRITAADASTRCGGWETNGFVGTELTGKCLGVVGCGTIGAIVADRAVGLRMRVVVFDLFLSPERALGLSVEKVDLDALLARADVITLHTPLTAQTRGILSAAALARTKRGVRIVNCARGGLLDEAALLAALDSGHVAGAALDVLANEPPRDNALTRHSKTICTPHLGASSVEAQENAALQVAAQVADFLLRGAVANAVNGPAVRGEEAPRLRPYLDLAARLGSFAGQLVEASVERVAVTYQGELAGLNTRALTAVLLAGLLRPVLAEVNAVSAPTIARARGIAVDEVLREAQPEDEALMALQVCSGGKNRTLAGAIARDGRPRLVALDTIRIDAPFAPQMVYVINQDRPGFVGRFAGLLGEAGINIATFALGRDAPGGNSIALAELEGTVTDDLLRAIRALSHVAEAHILRFAAP